MTATLAHQRKAMYFQNPAHLGTGESPQLRQR